MADVSQAGQLLGQLGEVEGLGPPDRDMDSVAPAQRGRVRAHGPVEPIESTLAAAGTVYLAQQSGHELTGDAADADVVVVNTCAFIDKAKQESIDTILEMAELKKTRDALLKNIGNPELRPPNPAP